MDSKHDDDDDEGYGYESKHQEEKELDSHGHVKVHSDRISDEVLLERVQKYFFEDASFTKTFESFVDRESSVIDLHSEEYSLEYTEVYERFKALFEKVVEFYVFLS